MAKAKVLFSLVRHSAPKSRLRSSPAQPFPTNLTPLRIRVQAARRRSREVAVEVIAGAPLPWPAGAKCYLQLWELDRWRRGRRRGTEHDSGAQRTDNDLIAEIGGFVQKQGPKAYRFVAAGPVTPPAGAPQSGRSIVLMLEMVEKGRIVSKKVAVPVSGEAETCFEIGIACEAASGQRRYTKSFRRPVLHILAHDDCICYLSDATNPAPRCSRGRMHFFVEAWMGHNAIGEDFYVFKYRGFKAGSFVSLGSLQSLEKVLRQLDQHLSKKANKNKKVGDLVILTHGVSYYVNQQLQTVKMQLPIFDPSARRVIPTWTLPNEIDAAELKKLTTTGSDYYSYVDGPKVRDGLVSKVLKRIKTHIDGQTHIWLTGCSLGLNPQLLAEVRRFFGGHPVVYAFTKKHFLRIWTNADGDVTSGRETLADGQRRVGVWTSEGTQWIKHVP